MADDDAALPVKKVLLIGDTALEITDPLNIQPAMVELYSELRLMNGIVAISLGSVIVDGNGQPELRIAARVRMTLETAINIRDRLTEVLADTQATKKAAN